MVKVRVSKEHIDDDVYIKSEKLQVNNKTIKTPIKSFDMTKLRRDTQISEEVKGVNEIFKVFTIDKIKDYHSASKDETDIHKKIQTSFKKTLKTDINFCFVRLDDKKIPSPEEIEDEINFITNIGYHYSDATPLPLSNAFFKEGVDAYETFEEYTAFLSSCIESINRWNNKPILGIIPSRMPSRFIKHLINFYYENDITSFAFDFDGRVHSGFDSHLREFTIAINKLDISNESFTYSCNTAIGKPSKGSRITKANDILVYSYGFDVMGDNHIPMKLTPEIAEKLKKRSNDSTIRLFNNMDYGHYKHDNINDARVMYPFSETNIPFEVFNGNNKKRHADAQRLFNSERVGLELLKYREILNQNESTFDYLKNKTQIVDDLPKIKEHRQSIKL